VNFIASVTVLILESSEAPPPSKAGIISFSKESYTACTFFSSAG